MSEQEYDAYEQTVLYHNRLSVPARDNPFQEWLWGQEAAVFRALQANENVPAEVLSRFEELKEWHETGSSPTIRENEARARKRQEEIASRPPIGTEETCNEGKRAGCRVIYVEPARLEHDYQARKNGDISVSYSADKISDQKSNVTKPFHFENRRYVSTGSGPLPDSTQAYELVPAREFKGDITTYAAKLNNNPKDLHSKYPGDAARNDPMGFYHGMQVISAGKPHVLVGPPIIFRSGNADTAPAGDLFKPPPPTLRTTNHNDPVNHQANDDQRPSAFALYYDSTYAQCASPDDTATETSDPGAQRQLRSDQHTCATRHLTPFHGMIAQAPGEPTTSSGRYPASTPIRFQDSKKTTVRPNDSTTLD